MRWVQYCHILLFSIALYPGGISGTGADSATVYYVPPSQGGVNTTTESIKLQPDSVRYSLEKHWIDSSSVTVAFGDSVLSPAEYTVNYIRGKLTFRVAPPETVATVTYRFFPLEFPLRFQRHPSPQLLPIVLRDSVRINQGTGSSRTRRSRESGDTFSGSTNLISNGSIFRELDLSTGRGLSVNSGLQLELDGRLGEDIGVTAALTDQSIPLQPEGTTQTLEEIDKVYINLDHQYGTVTFGDFTTDFQSGRFGQFRRKLEGVSLSGQYGDQRATVVGAISKGQYRTQQISGREGNQGPYRFTGRDGSHDIVILAGTERVWLDGERLTRGASQDYTIDYSNAEITFTPRRLITDESRIVVDFQYSDFQYNRSIYAGRIQSDLWNSKVKIRGTFAREADDRSNPLNPVINETVQDSLASLRDVGNDLRISTVSPDTSGEYIRVDSAGVTLYRYVGAGRGTHSVLFSRDPAGRYTRKTDTAGQVYYAFQPASGGVKYSPTVRVTPPRQHQVQNLQMIVDPTDRLRFSTEIAGSQLNTNTYAPAGTGTQGFAGQLEGDYALFRWGEGRQKNSLRIYGSYEHRGETFNPIDRAESVEFRRNWNLRGTDREDILRGRTQSVAGIRLRNFRHLRGHIEWGQLTLPGGIRATRNTQRLSGQYGIIEQYRLYREEATTGPDDSRESQLAEVQSGIGLFHPFLRWRREEFRGDSSVVLQQPTAGITLVGCAGSRTSIRYSSEQIRERPDSLDHRVEKSRAQTVSWSGSWERGRTFRTQWDITHRRRDYAEWYQDRRDSRFFLADWSGSWREQSLEGVALRFSWDTLWEKEQIAKRLYRYIRVEPGRGEYRYDSTYADYFPDPEGEYILRIVPGEEFKPITGVQLGGEFHLDPEREKNGNKRTVMHRIFQYVRSVTRWRYEQKVSDGPPGITVYWDNIIRPDSGVVQRMQSLQEELHLFPGSPYYAIRYRFMKQAALSGLDFRGTEVRQREEHEIRWRMAAVRPWTVEVDLGMDYFTRNSYYQSLRNRDIRSRYAAGEIGYHPTTPHLLKTTVRIQQDRGRVAGRDIEVGLSRISEEYTYRLSGKGRLTARLGWANVRYTGDESGPQFLPYEVAEGYQPGNSLELDLQADYRLSKYLTLRLEYHGRDEPHRDSVYHRASGEIRAVF